MSVWLALTDFALHEIAKSYRKTELGKKKL